MHVRSYLNSAHVSTAAAAILLLALSAASLGCAIAACYGMFDQDPPARVPVAALETPHAPVAVAQSLVGSAEPLRCSPAHAARARRNGRLHSACRLADQPSA